MYSRLLHEINRLIKEGKTNQEIIDVTNMHVSKDLDLDYLIQIQRGRVDGSYKLGGGK